MHLYNRCGQRTDSILQGNTCMGISPCIQDNSIIVKTDLLQLVYHLAFHITLEIIYGYFRIFSPQFGKIFFERAAAINPRLAFAEKIQVGTVDYLYLHIKNNLYLCEHNLCAKIGKINGNKQEKQYEYC